MYGVSPLSISRREPDKQRYPQQQMVCAHSLFYFVFMSNLASCMKILRFTVYKNQSRGEPQTLSHGHVSFADQTGKRGEKNEKTIIKRFTIVFSRFACNAHKNAGGCGGGVGVCVRKSPNGRVRSILVL